MRAVGVAEAHDDVQQVVVRKIEQLGGFLFTRVLQKESFQNQIELQQSPPALPSQPMLFERHTERFTSSSLMWLMACVGLRCFGQTSTQFMMVWQRNNRYGSSRLSRRSLVVWSRESAMKRYACNSPARPTNLSGFHQNDGQAVEQQAQRMHSYRPLRCSRSCGDCNRSRSGGGSLLMTKGLI